METDDEHKLQGKELVWSTDIVLATQVLYLDVWPLCFQDLAFIIYSSSPPDLSVSYYVQLASQTEKSLIP